MPGPEWSPAVAGFTYEKRLGRTEVAPICTIGRDEMGHPVVDMLGRGSSASLSAMAMADGIAVLPPEMSLIKSGTVLRFEPLRTGEKELTAMAADHAVIILRWRV